MRREIILPEEDVEFLNSLGKDWETIKDANLEWLLVYGYPVPDGYNVKEVNIAVMITPAYPTAQLDMAYFNPALNRLNGVEIRATQCQQHIDGKSWQRWSRHRTPENPWRVGIDNMMTHFVSINHWLEREVK